MGWRASLGMGATAWEYWLRGQSPQDKPSCITDGNLFQGQNVGQLCRPPPFATFDLTTLPLTAPIRLLHSPRCHPYLSNDSSVHPAVTPGGGGGGLWSLCPQSAGSHFHSPPSHYGSLFTESCRARTVVAAFSEQDSGIQKLLL